MTHSEIHEFCLDTISDYWKSKNVEVFAYMTVIAFEMITGTYCNSDSDCFVNRMSPWFGKKVNTK